MKFMIEQLKKYIDNADAIVIGAGAGLSSAAGFEYGGQTFLDNFPYMYEKYGYDNMYSASFHNFKDEREKWAYWSKFIYLERYKDGAKELYKKLYDIVKDKNFFVITTNTDHQFRLACFPKERLFYTQGDYGLLQCSVPCHQINYDNEKLIHDMIASIKDNKIDESLIPHCPICGAPLEPNLRKDETFVEDDGWHKAKDRYVDFLEENRHKSLLFLDLGVGYNTPGIIKYPFWKMTANLEKAFYISINSGEMYVPDAIKNKSLVIKENLYDVIMNY